MTAGADLIWRQAQAFFDRWERLANRDPERVRQECLIYLRWLTRLEVRDPDAAVIVEVLREMVIEVLADLS